MLRSLTAAAAGLAVATGSVALAQNPPLDRITLPAGFSIAVYAPDVPNARSMARSPAGTLFVSTRQAGNVYAVLDRDQHLTATQRAQLRRLQAQGPVPSHVIAVRASLPAGDAVHAFFVLHTIRHQGELNVTRTLLDLPGPGY